MQRLLGLSFFIVINSIAPAQGVFSYSGLETINFSVIDLSASPGMQWGTDRLAQPGFISAVNGASFINGTDNSNINGYIKKYGNESFYFPVGSGKDIRALSITAPSNPTDAYATAWIPGDPGFDLDLTFPFAGEHPTTAVMAPLTAVSTIGQWDWQVGEAGNLGAGTTGTGNNLGITVSIPDMTMFASTSDLRLAGWNGSVWIDLSHGKTASGNTENKTLSGTMIAGITAIAIGSIKKPQSTSINLTGKVKDNCHIELKWKAPGYAVIKNFIIEQSADGRNYQEMSVVNGGSLPGENNYNAVITQNDIVDYYRLKIIYDNNHTGYSNTVAFQVSCSLIETIMVYPNPVREQEKAKLRITTQYRG